MKGQLADMLGVPPEQGAHPDLQRRRLVRHEGARSIPEYVCLAHAARALGRPVKWTDERSGSFVSDHHGRDHEMTRRAGARATEGNFLAVRITGYGNVGAYLGTVAPQPPTMNVVRNALRRVPHAADRGVDQGRASPTPRRSRAYRGAGRPEANYYMERLIDDGGARDGHRPARAAPAQPHPARGDAVQGACRHGLRQRRFRRGVREGAGGRRLGRVRGAQGREPRSAASCAASASAATSKSPRRRTRRWAASASRPTAP